MPSGRPISLRLGGRASEDTGKAIIDHVEDLVTKRQWELDTPQGVESFIALMAQKISTHRREEKKQDYIRRREEQETTTFTLTVGKIVTAYSRQGIKLPVRYEAVFKKMLGDYDFRNIFNNKWDKFLREFVKTTVPDMIKEIRASMKKERQARQRNRQEGIEQGPAHYNSFVASAGAQLSATESMVESMRGMSAQIRSLATDEVPTSGARQWHESPRLVVNEDDRQGEEPTPSHPIAPPLRSPVSDRVYVPGETVRLEDINDSSTVTFSGDTVSISGEGEEI